MRYGNCLVGALWLRWRYRREAARFIWRQRPHHWMPHFMVRTTDSLLHYRVVKNILPGPLTYVLFRGEFQTVPLSAEEEYSKRRVDTDKCSIKSKGT